LSDNALFSVIGRAILSDEVKLPFLTELFAPSFSSGSRKKQQWRF